MTLIETDRLRLRNVMAQDADIMYDYRNNEICARYQRGQTKDYDGIVSLPESEWQQGVTISTIKNDGSIELKQIFNNIYL